MPLVTSSSGMKGSSTSQPTNTRESDEMAPRRHRVSQPRKATKAAKRRRQKTKNALKKLRAETKEGLQKKLDASDRRMNATEAEILLLKKRLGEQRRSHDELVKKQEAAETEAELIARLASVDDDDEDEGAPPGVEKKKEDRQTTDSGLGSSIDSIAEETVNKRMMYKFGILHLYPLLKLNSDSEKRWKDIPTMFYF